MHAAHSSRAGDKPAGPRGGAAQGLEVSRGYVLQHQHLKVQVRHDPLQLRVLLLQFLQPSRLVRLQPTLLAPPTIVRLFRDPKASLHDTGVVRPFATPTSI